MSHCCYILEEATGLREDRCSYVGYSTNAERRLRQHNRVTSGGAAQTAHCRWIISAIITGFKDRHEALSFEANQQSRTVRDIMRRMVCVRTTLGCRRWQHLTLNDVSRCDFFLASIQLHTAENSFYIYI